VVQKFITAAQATPTTLRQRVEPSK